MFYRKGNGGAPDTLATGSRSGLHRFYKVCSELQLWLVGRDWVRWAQC